LIGIADILAILALLLAVVAMLVLALLWRELRGLRQELREQAQGLLTLHRSMKVVAGEAFQRAQDQAAVVRALERLADQQEQARLEMRLRDADHSHYAQAIKLIQTGRSREEVRTLCALTDVELDLLFGLHGQGVGPGLANRASTGL